MKYEDAVFEGDAQSHVFVLDLRDPLTLDSLEDDPRLVLVREIRHKIVDTQDQVTIHVVDDPPGPEGIVLMRLFLVGALAKIDPIKMLLFYGGLPVLSEQECVKCRETIRFLRQRCVIIEGAPAWMSD